MLEDLNSIWKRVNSSMLLRFLLLFACGWVVVQLIDYFYSVITIFTISATLAALLNYPVQSLSRYIPRGFAIAVTCIITFGLLIALIGILGAEIINQGQGFVTSLLNFLQDSDVNPIENFLDSINIERIIQTLQTGLLTGLGLVQGTFSNFLTLIFIVVICVYMLIDGSKIWSACLKILPVEIRDRFSVTVQESFIGFFRVQFLLVLFLSTSGLIVFSILGIQYALFLSIILGVIDLIPGIGGTLCVIVVSLLVFLSQGVWMGVKVLIAATILQQAQDNIISPKLMKDNLNINPVFLFFSLFVGERIAGILGVFLAIPIAGMLISWLSEPQEEDN
ncbi:AI-2E family transporter [Limnoraphis robusta]|uniref:AI-2E family transporter n=1 Tax=Limnoraphis robusta CCNP1315 TaxID=3110306 RepID=A0ABU5U3R3_9CYAN|nr:AI-2E family transporter [Limnoraphis robusta]MEA5521710.1 AI-2E family transporter [Limnoraphis robusta CCNP1315]MEA5548808.1 AI-2E family transporter [Limnoraphis robusta CCNP1324]